jgi:hypothetical protein
MQACCVSTLGIPQTNYSGTSNFLVRPHRYFKNVFPTFILFFTAINTTFKVDHISQSELPRNKEIKPQIRVAAGTSRGPRWSVCSINVRKTLATVGD